jgi:DNA repair exonuclease SbcCD ATPase subunit
MAADVLTFSSAIDKVYKTFSTQEVFDRKDIRGNADRGAIQQLEQRFQEQLQRARAAFLQEFRNHSVVVECEVRKIREELTEKLEDKYGEKIATLKKQVAEANTLVQKHADEIAQLKKLAGAQEAYLAAVRHRWGLDQRERLRSQIQQLRARAESADRENADLAHQLMCRDELVTQLGGELSALEGELKRQASSFAEEKRTYDDRLRNLRHEMRQQQDQFKDHLAKYEEDFAEYRSKTNAELQIQDIISNRRANALARMEEDHEKLKKARTKPSQRIGAVPDDGDTYVLAKGTKYRVDDMGMDTSWRDYRLNDGLTSKKAPHLPKFRVERTRQAGQVASLGPHAPIPSEVHDRHSHSGSFSAR